MKSSTPSNRSVLQKRQLELQRIIRQMRLDQLHSGSLFNSLTQEAQRIEDQLASLKKLTTA